MTALSDLTHGQSDALRRLGAGTWRMGRSGYYQPGSPRINFETARGLERHHLARKVLRHGLYYLEITVTGRSLCEKPPQRVPA